MFHQIPLNSSAAAAGSSAKLRNKPYVAGITAGAEDVKYQAKYKELKKKVKEIESVRPSSSRPPPVPPVSRWTSLSSGATAVPQYDVIELRGLCLVP